MTTPTTMNQVWKQFMDGEPRPARGKLFRFKYWILARLFAIGEWAGKKITHSTELTPLEQLYMACDVSGCTPEFLRKKLELANSALLDSMAQRASLQAIKTGVVQ